MDFTDISGQLIEACLTLGDGTNRLFRNVGERLIAFYAAYNPQTSPSLTQYSGSL